MTEQPYKRAMAGLEFSLSVAFHGATLPIRYFLLSGAARQCLVSARLVAELSWREMTQRYNLDTIAIRRGERIIDVFDGDAWYSEREGQLFEEMDDGKAVA